MQLMRELSEAVVARARMSSLLLEGRGQATCVQVATWFGAMQAQDLASGKWSLGVRITDALESDVDAAFARAEVVRTWPMRGTLHVVPARDVRWMLELTGIRALNGSLARRRQLGLDDADAERACTVLENSLRAEGRLGRADCLAELRRAGIPTDGQRGYHLLGYAAHTGVICLGPPEGKEQAFVLLDAWAPDQVHLNRSDALTELAHRYFRSHGPATMRDFAGWSGLTLTDARAGVASNDGRLVARPFRGDDVWLTRALSEAIDGGTPARSVAAALPGYDEFVLGYKDRGVQMRPGEFEQVVPGGNGVFRATVCLDGRVVGTWTRGIKRGEVVIDFVPLRALTAAQHARAARAFEAYGQYLGRAIRLG
jgi:hypothetical protein